MSKQIIWSPSAENDFAEILNYLFTNWGVKISNTFIDKVDHDLQLISQSPTLFPEINKELGIRKCVITKHNSLFYMSTDTKIEIVRIFDTRQNPDKLTFD